MLVKLTRRLIKHLKQHWLKYIIIPVLYFGLLAYLVSLSKDNFHHTITGITYRLGDESSFEVSEIEFIGRRTKSLLRKGKFEGIVIFGEHELEVSLFLDNDNSDVLVGWTPDYDNDVIGRLYSNNNFEQITICIHEKKGFNSKSWNSDTGLMFSGPATNREEALEISNDLIHRKFDFR